MNTYVSFLALAAFSLLPLSASACITGLGDSTVQGSSSFFSPGADLLIILLAACSGGAFITLAFAQKNKVIKILLVILGALFLILSARFIAAQ